MAPIMRFPGISTEPIRSFRIGFQKRFGFDFRCFPTTITIKGNYNHLTLELPTKEIYDLAPGWLVCGQSLLKYSDILDSGDCDLNYEIQLPKPLIDWFGYSPLSTSKIVRGRFELSFANDKKIFPSISSFMTYLKTNWDKAFELIREGEIDLEHFGVNFFGTEVCRAS